MTQIEEIQHIAGSIADGMKQNYVSDSECKGYYDGFIDGVEWADKTIIDKAVAWLKENTNWDLEWIDDERNPNYGLINDFCKTMEE